MKEMSLNQMDTGDTGIIASIDLDHNHLHRLNELGFCSGNRIKVLHKAPSGSPVAYFIKDTVVALRSEDSRNIRVIYDKG